MTRALIVASLIGLASPAAAQGLLDTLQQVTNTTAQTHSLTGVTQTQASGALKSALGKAVDSVVGRLGQTNGFLNDPLVKIGLPGGLSKAAPLLEAMGQAGLLSDLEARMNHGAEQATPLARKLFKTAIDKMTVTDAIGIVTGGQDAATQYLRRTAGTALEGEMRPIVAQQLRGAGATRVLGSVTSKLGNTQGAAALAGAVGNLLGGSTGESLQSVKDFNMTNYVTSKAVDGIFSNMAKEEANIRANPLASGSKLIETVFGAVH